MSICHRFISHSTTKTDAHCMYQSRMSVFYAHRCILRLRSLVHTVTLTGLQGCWNYLKGTCHLGFNISVSHVDNLNITSHLQTAPYKKHVFCIFKQDNDSVQLRAPPFARHCDVTVPLSVKPKWQVSFNSSFGNMKVEGMLSPISRFEWRDIEGARRWG